MQENVIKLTLGDWTWNASVLGFINILGIRNADIKQGNSIEVPLHLLEGFEDKYFNYFIRTYRDLLPLYRIIGYTDEIKRYQNENFENFTLKSLQYLNVYIKDVVKKYIVSNSFKAAYELIDDPIDILVLEKKIQKITEPKDEISFQNEKNDIIKEVKERYEILEQIIQYCSSSQGIRYIGAKNIIYSIIKNGWNGVCFLNPQTKIKDVYEDYRTYFLKPALEHINTNHSKSKYQCFTCGSDMKNLNLDLSFLNETGFDTARKLSHVWNFFNDISICPMCKLIYSCLPAGFAYVGNRGVYINANIDINYNHKVNSEMKKSILLTNKGSYSTTRIYAALIDAVSIQEIEKKKFELADVQIVHYTNDTYRFNLLSEKTIELLVKFRAELAGKRNILSSDEGASKGLLKTAYKEGKESISIYEQVLNYLFNNQNLYLLLNKLLHYKISVPDSCFFHMGHIMDMIKINLGLIENLEGGIFMNRVLSDYEWKAKEAGLSLRIAYNGKENSKRNREEGKEEGEVLPQKNDGVNRKINGINYRLLNALKTGNKNMFLDTVFNCYMYVGKAVPSFISEVIIDNTIFYAIGYPFVAGFIDGGESEVYTGSKKQKDQ